MNNQVLENVNRTTVAVADLEAVLDEANLMGETHERCFELGVAAAARVLGRNFEKISAVMFRLQALSRLLSGEGAPGWTLPSPDGNGILAAEALIAAAAAEPLVERDHEVVFDRETFLRRALELSDPQGHA